MLSYLLGLILIVVAGWIFAIATGWELPYDILFQGLFWLRMHPWESVVISVFLLFIGVLPFLRLRRPTELSFYTSSKWGEVRVTQEALSEIIVRSALNFPGVRNVYPVLSQRPDGLEILLRSQFNPEFVIPQISEELQVRIKEDVEHYTGIRVAEVKVLVRSVEPARQARVR